MIKKSKKKEKFVLNLHLVSFNILSCQYVLRWFTFKNRIEDGREKNLNMVIVEGWKTRFEDRTHIQLEVLKFSHSD